MRVSIVTPSFNQAQFLPFNLQSVASQTYSDIEHIVVDPGSTDASRDIAATFNGVILIAEPDRGQSDGIDKGFSRSTGDILAWLNSDDLYPTSEVVERVVKIFQENPEIDVVYGQVNFVDEKGEFLRNAYINADAEGLLASFQYQVGIIQPGVFMRRAVYEKVGGPSKSFEYCMDYEYWVRIATAGFKWFFVDEVLAHHRWWSGMKTSSGRDKSLIEHFRVVYKYFGYIHWKWLERYADFKQTNADGIVNVAKVDQADKDVGWVIKRYVSQNMLTKLAGSTDKQCVETVKYIRKHCPEKLERYGFDCEEVELKGPSARKLPHFSEEGTNLTAADGRKFTGYSFAYSACRLLDTCWQREALNGARNKLERLSPSRRDTCVIVGSGADLRGRDLASLAEADVIISDCDVRDNGLRSHATILTVTDPSLAAGLTVELSDSRLTKVVPIWLSADVNDTEETVFVSTTAKSRFPTWLRRGLYSQASITYFNVQLAYQLGYQKVLLTGLNERAPALDLLNDRDKPGRKGIANETEELYRLARRVFEVEGREIVDCSDGGTWGVFRTGILEEEVGTTSRVKADWRPQALWTRLTPWR